MKLCSYCNKDFERIQVDHIIPRSKNGTDIQENLTYACRKCNAQKKDKTLEEFLLLKKIKYFKKSENVILNNKIHHKMRGIRLDEENWGWLNSIKRGTWNYTITNLRKKL